MTRERLSCQWVAFFACCIAMLMPFLVSAQQTDETPINADFISQYGLRNLENAVIIRATPENPGAGETVHFTAESPLFNLAGDTITWVINGQTVASGVGITSADAVIDAQGDTLAALLTVVDPVWGPASYRFTFVPLQLDILYDAPTYVPPFYRGRTLPSAGGKLRLQALARFMRNGSLLSDSSIQYSWSRNGIALGRVSGIGKSSVEIEAPALYDTDRITVRATASDGSLSATASVFVPSATVEVALYEDHPLFGFMFHKMLGRENQLPGEITLAGFPYFVTASTLYDPSVRFAWYLNGKSIAATSTKRNAISLSPSEEPASVRLSVTHALNFFLDALGSWKFDFGSIGNVNGSAGAVNNDVFHSDEI